MAKRGRKGYEREIQTKKLWKLSTKILLGSLKSDKIKDSEKRRVSLELVKKMCPTLHEVTGEMITKVKGAVEIKQMDDQQLREYIRNVVQEI